MIGFYLSEKFQYFSLYLYQDVLFTKGDDRPKTCHPAEWASCLQDSHLELYDLKDITDEHAKLCGFVDAKDVVKSLKGWKILLYKSFDQFRSLGYAVDWIGTPVEDFVKEGWVVIKKR